MLDKKPYRSVLLCGPSQRRLRMQSMHHPYLDDRLGVKLKICGQGYYGRARSLVGSEQPFVRATYVEGALEKTGQMQMITGASLNAHAVLGRELVYIYLSPNIHRV